MIGMGPDIGKLCEASPEIPTALNVACGICVTLLTRLAGAGREEAAMPFFGGVDVVDEVTFSTTKTMTTTKTAATTVHAEAMKYTLDEFPGGL